MSGNGAVLSSAGVAPNGNIAGGNSVFDVAVLNTNTDPTSTLGLKASTAFTVSSTFNLTAPPTGGYGMELTDGTSTHGVDQLERLIVQNVGGSAVVELIQANLTTNTQTVVASHTLTSAELADNTQIEFQMSHAASATAVSGAFELIDNGAVTSTTTFGPTASIFTNGITYTRVDVGAFANTGVGLNLAAGHSPQEGQTLIASASTNDSDATINYQWEESSTAAFTTFTDIGTNSPTYAIQESDLGSFIRVVATTSDSDNSQSATATSVVTGAVVAGAPSAANSTIVASPASVTANGVSDTTLVVTVKDAEGNPVAAGTAVTLSASGSANTFAPISGTTNANGVFTTTLSSTVAQTETVTATEGGAQENTSVTFVAGAPAATKSSIVASPGSVTANGTSTTALTVTVEDANGNAVAGSTVTLSASGSGNTFAPITGTTNASGVFTATLASTVAQTETVTATEGAAQESTSVTFVAGGASATKSTIVASPGSVAANGVSDTSLTVTVEDINGNAVAGTAVTLSASGSSNVFAPIFGTTNASGVFTATLASTVGQIETVTATEGSAQESTSVTFDEVAPVLGGSTSATVNEGGSVTLGATDTTAFAGNALGNVTFTGLPTDLTSLNGGTYTASSGSWSGTAAQFNALSFRAGEPGTFTLSISAATAGPGPATASDHSVLTVNPVAPNLTAPASLAVNEGGTVALNISETPFEPSDTVSITIAGVPAHATLSAGTSNGSGTWTLTPAQLSGLTLTADDATTANLTVTATNTGGATASSSKSIALTVNPVAPVITSNAAAASGSFSELANTTGSTATDSVGGTITFTDDLYDTHTVSAGAPGFSWSGGTLSAGQLSALSAASALALTKTDSTGTGTGSVGWTYSVTDGALDFLAAGQTLTASYDVTVASSDGTNAQQPVTVTITGTNDAPQLHLAGGSSGTTFTTVNYAAGNGSTAVTTADVNGDGKLDLVVANYTSNTVSVLLGNGDGSFQPQTTYATGSSPYFVAIGDVNGDGKPDLAVADFGTNTVSVLLGNGNGTFPEPNDIHGRIRSLGGRARGRQRRRQAGHHHRKRSLGYRVGAVRQWQRHVPVPGYLSGRAGAIRRRAGGPQWRRQA